MSTKVKLKESSKMLKNTEDRHIKEDVEWENTKKNYINLINSEIEMNSQMYASFLYYVKSPGGKEMGVYEEHLKRLSNKIQWE